MMGSIKWKEVIYNRRHQWSPTKRECRSLPALAEALWSTFQSPITTSTISYGHTASTLFIFKILNIYIFKPPSCKYWARCEEDCAKISFQHWDKWKNNGWSTTRSCRLGYWWSVFCLITFILLELIIQVIVHFLTRCIAQVAPVDLGAIADPNVMVPSIHRQGRQLTKVLNLGPRVLWVKGTRVITF